MSPRALVLLAEGFEETEAVAVIDLLRRAGIEVAAAGLTDREVTGSHGVTIRADASFDACMIDFDAIILPGGMPGAANLASSELLLEFIADMYHRDKLCAAICAAPQVLAKAGILAGKKVTCYPGVEEKLTGAKVSTDPVVRDGNIITSRGVGTAIPFALAIIAYLMDQAAADKVGTAVLFR
jgi:4-methyl-5(b-hydroxyethyl)-thiazole monophosphate biosynthesis